MSGSKSEGYAHSLAIAWIIAMFRRHGVSTGLRDRHLPARQTDSGAPAEAALQQLYTVTSGKTLKET